MTDRMTENLSTESTPASSPRPRRRVVQNTVFSVLSRVLSAVVSYSATVMLLRALSVEHYGLYSVLYVGVIVNLNYLGQLGIPNLLSRFVPEFFTQSNFRFIHRLFSRANLVQVAFAAVLLIITFLLAPNIARWMGLPGSATVLRVFAAGAFAYVISTNFRVALGALFQHRTIFFVDLGYGILRLAVVYWITRQPDPVLAIVAAEGALFLALLAGYFAAYRIIMRPRLAQDTHVIENPQWGRYVRYSSWYYLNELGLVLVNQATDMFLVTGLLGAVAAGIYGLANRILQMTLKILPDRMFQEVVAPVFYSEYGTRTPAEARFGFNLLVKVSLLTSLPLVLWLSVMSRPIIVEFFDARYADAAAILSVCAPFLSMAAVYYPLTIMLQNAERPDLLLYSQIVGVVKIAVSLWLLPLGGVMAMAWITSIATLVQVLLLYAFIVRVLKVHTDYVAVGRLLLNGGLAAGALYLLSPLFQGALGVIASVPIYAAIYLTVSMVNRSFSEKERELINSKLPWPLWRF